MAEADRAKDEPDGRPAGAASGSAAKRKSVVAAAPEGRDPSADDPRDEAVMQQLLQKNQQAEVQFACTIKPIAASQKREKERRRKERKRERKYKSKRERKGKERKRKERKGKERKRKERKGATISFSFMSPIGIITPNFISFIFLHFPSFFFFFSRRQKSRTRQGRGMLRICRGPPVRCDGLSRRQRCGSRRLARSILTRSSPCCCWVECWKRVGRLLKRSTGWRAGACSHHHHGIMKSSS